LVFSRYALSFSAKSAKLRWAMYIASDSLSWAVKFDLLTFLIIGLINLLKPQAKIEYNSFPPLILCSTWYISELLLFAKAETPALSAQRAEILPCLLCKTAEKAFAAEYELISKAFIESKRFLIESAIASVLIEIENTLPSSIEFIFAFAADISSSE